MVVDEEVDRITEAAGHEIIVNHCAGNVVAACILTKCCRKRPREQLQTDGEKKSRNRDQRDRCGPPTKGPNTMLERLPPNVMLPPEVKQLPSLMSSGE